MHFLLSLQCKNRSSWHLFPAWHFPVLALNKIFIYLTVFQFRSHFHILFCKDITWQKMSNLLLKLPLYNICSIISIYQLVRPMNMENKRIFQYFHYSLSCILGICSFFLDIQKLFLIIYCRFIKLYMLYETTQCILSVVIQIWFIYVCAKHDFFYFIEYSNSVSGDWK